MHGPFSVRALYRSGIVMEISGDNPNGVRFEGSEGWIFVARGDAGVTSSDPGAGGSREVLAADPQAPGLTLSNTLARKEARELLDDADDYF